MPRIDSFFDDDYFVQHQDFSYEDPKDMAQFGELMDKFAGRMHDPEGWSLEVNAHNVYVQVTGKLDRHKLYSPTSESRNSPWRVR